MYAAAPTAEIYQLQEQRQMQYRPLNTYTGFLWQQQHPLDDPMPFHLPESLFRQLVGGILRPPHPYVLGVREYGTEAEALADLEQAAQALYFSQHQPAQYQNPF